MQFARSGVDAEMDIDRVPPLPSIPWDRSLAAARMIDLCKHMLDDAPAEK